MDSVSLPAGSVRAVRRSGLRGEVYHSILDMLIDNRLPEGAPLRVEALASLLEVSPTPVREALVQLESTGLVRHAANRGYRVAELPTAREMRQIVDARTVLEVAAARRSAEQNDRDFVQRLSDLVVAQRSAVEQLDEVGPLQPEELIREYLTLDHEFHNVIFRESGNPFLVRLAQTLDAQAQRARQSFRYGLDDAAEATEEHAVILEAIAAGDADAAESATRTHMNRMLESALAHTDG